MMVSAVTSRPVDSRTCECLVHYTNQQQVVHWSQFTCHLQVNPNQGVLQLGAIAGATAAIHTIGGGCAH